MNPLVEAGRGLMLAQRRVSGGDAPCGPWRHTQADDSGIRLPREVQILSSLLPARPFAGLFVFQEIFQAGHCVRVLTTLYSVSVEVTLSTNDGDERLREGTTGI